MKISEIKPSGVPHTGSNEASTSAAGSRQSATTRTPPPPDERLSGRPPQTSGAEGSRRRVPIAELRTGQSAQDAQTDVGHSNRSSRSWVSIPLHGSESGASERATQGSDVGISGRHTFDIEGHAPVVAARPSVASRLSSLASGATAAAGAAASAAGSSISSGFNKLRQLVASGGTYAASELRQQGEALGMVLPSKRILGAVAGHLVHQSAAVGVPTFLREMMAEATLLSMRHMPPDHALALQVVSGTVSVSLQLMRRRLEARDPDAAARGFHAMSKEKWAALPPDRQAKLRREQDMHSRMALNIQVLASMTQIGVGAYAARSGDKALAEMPAKLFVQDFKSMVYSPMRETVQASFNMVGMDHDSYGISGAHLQAAAGIYSMTTVTGNYAFSYLPSLVPNASLATSVLRGESDLMSKREAWMTRAAVSAVKAAINTSVHTSDWITMTQQEANQHGTVQRWKPKLKFLDRASHDYSRLLDHTPGRITLIAGSNAMSNAVGLAMKDMPGWASTTALNLLSGAYEGLIYKTIGNTWQAQFEVRSAVKESAPPQLGQPPLGRDEAQISASSRMRGQG